jgi:hypothetical protein
MNDPGGAARRSVAPPEVDWQHLDKKKFLMLGAAVFSVRLVGSRGGLDEGFRAGN